MPVLCGAHRGAIPNPDPKPDPNTDPNPDPNPNRDPYPSPNPDQVLRDKQSLKAEIIQAARHHLYGARSGGLRALSHGFTGGDRHLETAAARKKEEEQLEGRDENCYYFPALQLFSPADVALRLRGRELVEPAEAWKHFYPEALSEGTPIMGVPSSDEVERTT